jgi:hypothetical protein
MGEQKKIFTTRAVVQMLFFIIIMPLLPLLISWRWDWWEAWVYGIISILGFIISRMLATKRNPGLLKERAGYMHQDDAQSWDKLLSPLVALGGGLILLIAGLDKLFGWPPDFSLPVELLALAVILAGYALGAYALIENRYFSGVVRL